MNTLSKGEQTKQKIIESAAQLIYQQGFNHTGITQILKTANVSKGSFYFHFDDKDQLGFAIIDHYRQQFKNSLPLHLHNRALSSREKITAFHQHYYDAFSQSNFSYGCPIGNLTQELTDLCPVFAQKLNDTLQRMSQVFMQVITQGIEDNEISPEIDAEQTAYFIVDSWEGAMLRMKALSSGEPLNRWHAFTLKLLS